MTTLPSYISDVRVDPFTKVDKPRAIAKGDEIHDCRDVLEQGWAGIKLFEDPQSPDGSETPDDKLKLWQEDGVAAGTYNNQFTQIDVGDEPSSGQFKVAWGSATGLIKMSAADKTSVTGLRFAVEYSGLGTIVAALYHLVLPPGSFTWFFEHLAGAYSLVEMKQFGWAVADGTTAASQGILDPLIAGALPDLTTAGRFVRAAGPGGAGVAQAHALQYHFHSKSLIHSHGVTDPGHTHQNKDGSGVGSTANTYDGQRAFDDKLPDSGAGSFELLDAPTGISIDNASPTAGDVDPSNSSGHDPVNVAEETRPNNITAIPLIKVK